MAQRLKTDWILFLTIVAMVAFGLVMVYSASSAVAEMKYGSSWHFFLRQLGWAMISFSSLMFFKRQDYRVLKSPVWAFASLGVVLAMLAAVYFLDPRTHRWFRMGFASLQPSEFAKPALIIFLAYFITLRSRAINDRHTLLPAAMAVAMLALTVLVADLGTAVVLAATAMVVFYVAGLEKKYFWLVLGISLLVAVAAVASKGYRLGRVIAYVDPDYSLIDQIDPAGHIKNYVQRSSSTRDPSYQALQSKIAVGAGGVLGVGLMQSKQKLMFLPEAHTDFIYAVVGEELGLWGSIAVLAGFLVVLWRGLRLFWLAPDDFGRYLALGVTAAIAIQALINISVVLGVAPTKGIPLPMISSGGSSLLATLTLLGLLLSVSEHSG